MDIDLMRSIAKLIAITPLYLMVNSAFATNDLPVPSFYNNSNSDYPVSFFPWPFRATAWGLAGNRNVGIGDAMLPLFGNNIGMFYGDAQVKYAADSNWVDSFGGGYRYVYDCKRIFGAYVFADHNVFKNVDTNQSTFWMVSPGIESLGNIWDFRVNGYFPVSSQTENKGTFFGDQIGINNVVVFQGHSQFDQLFTITNNVGPGVDGEIGYTFPFIQRNTRFYLGGYYFSPKNTGNIRGISGRLEFPLNHYFALTAADTYDNNVNNSFEAGLRVTIGGNTDDQTSQDIERRIVDPVSRNLATLSQGTGAPVTTETVADGLALERTNIYFFSASPTTPTLLTNAGAGTTQNGLLGATTSNFNPALGNANCTFEHPCSGTSFTQATVNSINSFAPGTNFYLNTGAYNLNGQMFLNNGQSIYGRSLDYIQAANGAEQPQLFGALQLLSNNTLDSFTMFNNGGAQNRAILIENARNNFINNLNIGQFNDEQGYHFGIEIDNSSLNMTNSTINTFGDTSSQKIAGIATMLGIPGAINLNLNNDTLHTIQTLNSDQVGAGIFINNPSTDGDISLAMTNSTINVNNTSIDGINSAANGIIIVGINNIALILAGDNIAVSQNSPQGSVVSGVNISDSPTNPAQNINVSTQIADSTITTTALSAGNSIVLNPIVITLLSPVSATAQFTNTLNLSNDVINGTGNGATSGAFLPIAAVELFGSGNNINQIMNINNTRSNFNFSLSGGDVTAFGISSFLGSNGNTTISINNSTFNVIGTATGAGFNSTVNTLNAANVGTGTNIVNISDSFLTALAAATTGTATAATISLSDTINHNSLQLFNTFLSAIQTNNNGTQNVSPGIIITG